MSTGLSIGAEIRFATAQDIEPASRLLAEMFRGTSVPFWRTMLNYPWLATEEKPHYGAVLVVNGQVCGFNGVMFADRMIDGRIERFAGGFGWCCRPEYRRFSLGLLSQLKMPNVTWTNLTSRGDLVPLFRRLGYSLADTRKLICYPRPAMFMREGIRVVPDEEVTPERLGADIYRIYADHVARTVQRIVVEADGETHLVITKRQYLPGRLRGFPATELFYSSDREFLARHFDRILLRLLMRDKTVALAADERLLGFQPRGADSAPTTPLFRSATVPAERIDALYTELVMLP